MPLNKTIFFCTLFTLTSYPVFGSEEVILDKDTYKHEISLLIGDSENGLDQGLGRSLAFEFQYMYQGFDFPIQPEVAIVYAYNIPVYQDTDRASYTALLFNGVYEVDYVDMLTPYLKGGAGYRYITDNQYIPSSQVFLDAGAGLKFHMSPQWALQFEVLYTHSADSDTLLAMVGLSYAFGKKPQKHVEEPIVVANNPEPLHPVQPKPVPAPVSASVKTKEIFIVPLPIVLHKEAVKELTIKFKFNSAELTADSKKSIATYTQKITIDDNAKIKIVGNTDSAGTEKYNMKLSIRRADAVRNELVANGIGTEYITTEGDGEHNPVADNSTKEGRSKNRRVSITFGEQE